MGCTWPSLEFSKGALALSALLLSWLANEMTDLRGSVPMGPASLPTRRHTDAFPAVKTHAWPEVVAANASEGHAHWVPTKLRLSIAGTRSLEQSALAASATMGHVVNHSSAGEPVRAVHMWQRRGPVSSVTVLSGSNMDREWTMNVTDNHERFAASQGYKYKYLNMSDWPLLSKGKEPQWLKVRALLDTLLHTESDYVLWVDDDIVFTSSDPFVERMVVDMQGKSLLVARDIRLDQINTGMMLFRVGEESDQVLRDLWRESQTPLGYCKEQSCFHEQEALNNLIGSGVACAQVVDPVNSLYNMNTMWRRSHYDEIRKASRGSRSQMYLDYDENDPPSQRWKWGMNTAHVSGMTPSCRAPMLGWIAEYARRFVFAFEPGEEAFKETSPYTARCQQHLGRKRRRVVARSAHFYRLPFPANSSLLSREAAADDHWAEGDGLRPKIGSLFEPSSGQGQRASASAGGEYYHAYDHYYYYYSGGGVGTSEPVAVLEPLVEIVGRVLPGLLGHVASVARLDLQVNYTASDAPKSGEEHDFSMKLAGRLLMSEEGNYEFLTELANVSQDGRYHMRMQSGKAALAVGARNLSFEFSPRDRGAGVVFNYFWEDDDALNASSAAGGPAGHPVPGTSAPVLEQLSGTGPLCSAA